MQDMPVTMKPNLICIYISVIHLQGWSRPSFRLLESGRVESGPGRFPIMMAHDSIALRVGRNLMFLVMTAACATLPTLAQSGQDQPRPVRVAIVGLAHDHVNGFFEQL